jgi:hypothetical protein
MRIVGRGATVPPTGREANMTAMDREVKMTATDGDGSSYNAPPTTGWTGWVVFAAVFMIVTGAMNAIQGVAALIRDEAYWVTLGGTVLAFDITTWGWIHLIFGILLVIVGALLMRGSTFARVLGVILVALNLIAQFSWTTLYPFWALIAIIIDVLIIYALVVHGRELKA